MAALVGTQMSSTTRGWRFYARVIHMKKEQYPEYLGSLGCVSCGRTSNEIAKREYNKVHAFKNMRTRYPYIIGFRNITTLQWATPAKYLCQGPQNSAIATPQARNVQRDALRVDAPWLGAVPRGGSSTTALANVFCHAVGHNRSGRQGDRRCRDTVCESIHHSRQRLGSRLVSRPRLRNDPRV